ncbi:SGNH hydrolase-type esterase domain containing protein [Rhypophila decipiens]
MVQRLTLSRALLPSCISLLWMAQKAHAVPPASTLHDIRSNDGDTISLDGVGLFNLLARQDDSEEADPSDLSWIKKLASIGDSYSAGIGAGKRLGNLLDGFVAGSDGACGRYDHAFPYLVNQDPRLGDTSGRSFEFKACSGAVSKDVIEQQIPSLSDGQQAILLSIGGNDAGLVDLLNQCVFQWGVFNPEQVALGKIAAEKDPNYAWAKNINFDKLGRGCAAQMTESNKAIQDPEFSKRLDKLLDDAKAKLAPGGKIYMAGYGEFWNEETSVCDSVSWSSWVKATYNNWQENVKLSKDNRKVMNELVRSMNKVLEDAAGRHSGEVIFINYNDYVKDLGGRYCEYGVDESTTDSNARKGLMFYKHNSLDPLGNTPYKRLTNEEVITTFAGTVTGLVGITRLIAPDAQFADPQVEAEGSDGGQQRRAAGPSKRQEDPEELEKRGLIVPNMIPDGYARVFHPTIILHQLIANLVVQTIASHHNKDALGGDLIPEKLEFDSCPIPPDAWKAPDQPSGGEEGPKFEWEITIYDNVECHQEDAPGVLPVTRPNEETRSRTIKGTILDECYTFNDAMPGTDCVQNRQLGAMSEFCDEGPLTPKSIGNKEGSRCQWYLEKGCRGGGTAVPDDKLRCVDTHTVVGYGREIQSFKCHGPDGQFDLRR